MNNSNATVILLVEDELILQDLTSETLAEFGFVAAVAASIAEARAKMDRSRGKIAAAIIDIGLPDGRGDALAMEWRAVYPSLPIILASGYDAADVRQRIAGQSGMAVLMKPYSADQLQAALRLVTVADLPPHSP